MTPVPATITDDIFAAFHKCPYKAYLKLRGETGQVSDFARVQARVATEYRRVVPGTLQRSHGAGEVVHEPPSLPDALRAGAGLILDVAVGDGDVSCRLDAVVPSESHGTGPGGACIPVLFIPHERITADDRLRLAFGATALARVLGTRPDRGRIVHGPHLKTTRVELTTLTGAVDAAVGQIRALDGAAVPPPQQLNRHCAECEFRRPCRAAAAERDDLSLLRGCRRRRSPG